MSDPFNNAPWRDSESEREKRIAALTDTIVNYTIGFLILAVAGFAFGAAVAWLTR